MTPLLPLKVMTPLIVKYLFLQMVLGVVPVEVVVRGMAPGVAMEVATTMKAMAMTAMEDLAEVLVAPLTDLEGSL